MVIYILKEKGKLELNWSKACWLLGMVVYCVYFAG